MLIHFFVICSNWWFYLFSQITFISICLVIELACTIQRAFIFKSGQDVINMLLSQCAVHIYFPVRLTFQDCKRTTISAPITSVNMSESVINKMCIVPIINNRIVEQCIFIGYML